MIGWIREWHRRSKERNAAYLARFSERWTVRAELADGTACRVTYGPNPHREGIATPERQARRHAQAMQQDGFWATDELILPARITRLTVTKEAL